MGYNDNVLDHYGIKTAGRLKNEWTCKVEGDSIRFSGEAWVGKILHSDPGLLCFRIEEANSSLQDDHVQLMSALNRAIKRNSKFLSIEDTATVTMMTKGFAVKRGFTLNVVGKAPQSLQGYQDEAVRDLLEAIQSFGIKMQGRLIVK